MSYLERAQAATTVGGQPCKLAKAMATMPPDVQADVAEAIRADVSAPALSKLLRDDGYPITDDSVRRHRAGKCMTCLGTFPG